MARPDIRNQVYSALMGELAGKIGQASSGRLKRRMTPDEEEEQARIQRIEENEPFTLIGDPSEPPPLEGDPTETYYGKSSGIQEAEGGESGDGQVTCPQCGTRLHIPESECPECAKGGHKSGGFRY